MLGGLIEIDAAGFVLDENLGGLDKNVDVAELLDFLFELDGGGDILEPERAEELDPKELGVRFFGALSAPIGKKFFDGVASFDIVH